MNHPIYPCLWFDGQAKEAADFYCTVFKNAKVSASNPFVTTFEVDGKLIMCLNGGPLFKFNPSISISVMRESIEETNQIWDKLSEGGQAMMPIDKYPWSERYGWVQDKFGFTWQISVANKDGQKFQIIPSMLFTGKNFGRAEEAVDFYLSIFKNSSKDFVVHYPPEDPNAGKLMYSEFKLNNYELILMDGPGNHNYTFNEAVSLVVNCKTQDEIDYYWGKLTEGGEESQCGWLKDKFGVSWQIVPAILGELMSKTDKADRVTEAFMKMKKLNIEALENA